jgi:predicted ATPase
MKLIRLYANNYRCLVNFEIRFDALTLVLGPNGGGKTTIFRLLSNIRRLVIDNQRISEVFPLEDRTIWMDSGEQKFELEVASESGIYLYKLLISHDPGGNRQRIDGEELYHENRPIFLFSKGNVQLFRDDYSEGPPYSYDWSFSGLSTIGAREDNKKLTAFKQWLRSLLVLQIQPLLMKSESHDETDVLDHAGVHFASWYRYLSQEHQDKIIHLTQQLKGILPGFHAFKLELAGKSRVLKVGWVNGSSSSPFYIDFEHLSDGQRVIILLYTLLSGMRDLGYSLFIDEPENYVSIEEIQPWLMELQDACGEGFSQVVLISHHPELIDYLGAEFGTIVDRDASGPTRVREIPRRADDEMKLSEYIARGWID